MIGFKTKAMQEAAFTEADADMIAGINEQYQAHAMAMAKQRALLLLVQKISTTLDDFTKWSNDTVRPQDMVKKSCGAMIDKIFVKYYERLDF